MRNFVAVLVFAFAVTGVAHAQVSNSIDVTATVVDALTVTPGDDIEFGTLISGAGSVSVAHDDAGNGTFTVSGTPAEDITVSSSTTNLSDGGPNSINITATELYGNSSNSTTGAASVTGNVTLNGSGSYFFFVGATINVGSVPAGAYTGSYTLTVDYAL